MRRTVDFLLYDWLAVEALCSRSRYSEHSRQTFASVLDTCEQIAQERFAPFNRQVDIDEPRIEDDAVVLPRCAYDAARAYVESGMLAASQDYDIGGMQLSSLPFPVRATDRSRSSPPARTGRWQPSRGVAAPPTAS